MSLQARRQTQIGAFVEHRTTAPISQALGLREPPKLELMLPPSDNLDATVNAQLLLALRCPFCGEHASTVVSERTDLYFVRCEACQADGPPEETLQEAVAAWNYRAIGAPDRGLIADAANDPARLAGPQGTRSLGDWIADAIRIQLTSRSR